MVCKEAGITTIHGHEDIMLHTYVCMCVCNARVSTHLSIPAKELTACRYCIPNGGRISHRMNKVKVKELIQTGWAFSQWLLHKAPSRF